MKQDSQKKGAVDYKGLWAAIEQWWKELENQPGNRAELRRAHSPAEAALTPAYFDLLNKIRHTGLSMTMQCMRMPIVAGVLAHVKSKDDDSRVAKAMGPKGRARVSDLRFRRLLKTEDDTELYVMMIRMIRLLDEKVNVQDLAKSLTFWNERTRRDWAFLYYTGETLDASSESQVNDSK